MRALPSFPDSPFLRNQKPLQNQNRRHLIHRRPVPRRLYPRLPQQSLGLNAGVPLVHLVDRQGSCCADGPAEGTDEPTCQFGGGAGLAVKGVGDADDDALGLAFPGPLTARPMRRSPRSNAISFGCSASDFIETRDIQPELRQSLAH